MLLKIAYLLMRWTLSLAVLMFRGAQAKNAEQLVLRHENVVLRRTRARKVLRHGATLRLSGAAHQRAQRRADIIGATR